MPEIDSYAPGTPMWIDLGSPDLEASKTFYGALFGWEAQTAPEPEAGGYTLFTLNGKQVAGLGPLFAPGQPPAWSTYVATDNADATTQAVREAGGQVIMEPMDVLDAGRMAVFTDPTGAFFSVWQPREHRGAQIVNEPNSFCWNELGTRDLQAAKSFYSRVFGWGSDTNALPDGGSYTEWKLDGKSIAGAMEMTDQWPADVPPYWLTYFAVADADATVEKAQNLGAGVIVPPTDVDMGRFAVLSDPQGAVFGIMGFK